ncbi:MAG: hypothetical protein HOP10_07080 [Chitinophagaceae bacterium]|nr:hypothetical protein [Chitinophagaceae bacterium]
MIKSPELKDNLGCAGRILAEIKTNDASSDLMNKSLFTKSNFRQFSFKYLDDNRSFNVNESNKKLKVILIYSFSGGTYYDGYYKDIQDYFIKHQADVDLYIITLDPVSRLL